MSAREFNQNISRATRIAREEPVFITRRGTVEYVLVSVDEYRKLQDDRVSLLDAVYMPEAANIDLESGISVRKVEYRSVDFDT